HLPCDAGSSSLTEILPRPTGPFLPDGQTHEQDPDPPPGLVPFPGQLGASAGRPASGVGTSSSLIATMAASTRPEAPSLARMLPTWTPTVFWLMNSRSPISRFVLPSASRVRTSRSRRDRANVSFVAVAGSAP